MLEQVGALTPYAVIEDIRSGEYLLDVDGESAKVRRGARSLQEKLNRTLKLLSEDLYSKQTHFILELIQNADDNDYAPGVAPQLIFKLSPERLVLVNNEEGFSEKNVRSLCDVGKSSKAKQTGYIGEKGIGFKSVFTVSNTPEIHSNGYHFRFDRSNENNLLGYVVPIWCGAISEARDDTTTIILPAKSGSAFTSEIVEELNSILLLFLAKIRELRLEHTDGAVIYCRKDVDDLSLLSTRREGSGSAEPVDDIRFARVEKTLPMVDAPDEKRPGFGTSSVVLAFPVDANGAAAPQPASQIFAFLPIRQFGFKFSIQADFILSSSREDIHTDRTWNKGLRDGISMAFEHSLEQFKKSDALAFSYLKFIPTESEVSNSFFRPVVDQIIDRLSKTECLPSASGMWRVPEELRYENSGFRELFPSDVAAELFGFDYVDARVQAEDELLRKLGAKPITYRDYVNVFKSRGDWLKKQPFEWRAKFYGHLANLALQPLLKAGLLDAPCVPTTSGDLAVPNKTSVFFPLSRRKKYGFESELTIIDSELVDLAATHSSRVNEFFAALNVKYDDPYDLVTSYILPSHKDEAWKDSDDKALVGHLRYIKDKLTQYLAGAALASKPEAQALDAIRQGVWVGSKQRCDGSWAFDRVMDLYLSKEYKPKFCIESLLGDEVDEGALVSSSYLVNRANDAEAEAESWRTFFELMGVQLAPKLKAMPNGNWDCSPELQCLLDSPHSYVRKAALECLDQHWSEYARCLKYMGKIGRNTYVLDTQFVSALRSMNAPTRKRGPIPLAQSYYPTAELKDLFGDKPAYVDAMLKSTGLLNACNITHQVDSSACIKRLQQLKNEGGDTAPQLHKIYRNLERLWNKEGADIKQAFTREGLIRVKGTHATWARPEEVTWRPSSPFLDLLYPSLQGQYRDFSAFFEKLGVSKELPTARWVQALTRLDEIESLEERKREAIAIYHRANRDLTPRFGRDEVPTPDWLDVFESEEVFLNQHGHLVGNDESLFANDSPELASLFIDDEDISLLVIPFEDIPRFGRLLQAANVQLLSESAEVEVVEAPGGQVHVKLTNKVRDVLPFISRVVYAKQHACFEAAVASGLFQRLRDIEVVEVPELKLEVTLAGVARETSADIASSGDRILFRKGARSVRDQLATELCRFLGANEDLADTISRLLMEDDVENIEDFLRVRRIGPLPADVLASLAEEIWAQTASDEVEGEIGDVQASADSNEETERDLTPSEVLVETSDPPVSRLSETSIDGSPTAKAKTPGDQITHQQSATNQGVQGESQPRRKAPASGEPKQGTQSTSTLQAPEGGIQTGRAHKPVNGAQGLDTSNTDADGISTRDDAPGNPMVQTYSPTLFRNGEFGKSTEGAGTSRHQRSPGRALPDRTKTGRLLSYAGSPDEAQREREADSPEKAAARDATGQAAVDHFLESQSDRWRSLKPMPHNNPGFDVQAVAHDGSEEFIEVKGQSGAWTEEGVALTPTELLAAQRAGEHYWLCVVEYVHDQNRRALHLVKNPFGLTNQFRFDSGWRSAAINETVIPLKPEPGLIVEIPGDGRGRILSLRKRGQFLKLHVILDGGGQIYRTHNPATMKLFAE